MPPLLRRAIWHSWKKGSAYKLVDVLCRPRQNYEDAHFLLGHAMVLCKMGTQKNLGKKIKEAEGIEEGSIKFYPVTKFFKDFVQIRENNTEESIP